ncbi:hypothetical protein DQ04_00071210 [Trypanosoma grayi]|uniref:hypothetical protein n=1 Tax=Trypanosoma grayi TaxID=71804 RepID=UPI0004F49453|nr:hypothetical protein DQ04_00071210 [Trypanosoma grayi]KEG15453.1 hypothetical protein DQ04_00071210 [Trypanosoma grayi]
MKRLAAAGLLVWLFVLLLADYYLTHLSAANMTAARNEINSLVLPPPPPETTTTTTAAPATTTTAADAPEARGAGSDIPPEFAEALQVFERNLGVVDGLQGNPEQPTRDFTDIVEPPGNGVPLPHDASREVDARQWEACDQRDADFTPARDALCQAYLGDLNNMRYIKAMSSRLLQGRTIKFKVHYAHNGIEAIVKVSQKKFYFEATSEYLAFSVDRALNFSRIPTSVFVPLPLDYMKAATAYSVLFSQWIDRYVFQYNYTRRNFVPCSYPLWADANRAPLCAHVTIQLWMYDVHPALATFLALPYEYDSSFAAKYYTPGHRLWPPKKSRLRAIGDIHDRFIFDFLIGNTDRGMNDHNNFVYGGCSYKTTCERSPKEERIKGMAKYAFLDHGSSLYSHREPKDNAFFGELERIPICRFRRSTYNAMLRYRETNRSHSTVPLVMEIRKTLSPYIFRVTHLSVFEKVQTRLEKILRLVERCLELHEPEDVFSLPAYWEIPVPEEAEDIAELGAQF